MLKPCIPSVVMADLQLHLAPLWIQMHGFPMGCVTRQLATKGGAKVGDVLAVDFGMQKKVVIGYFVLVKVLFNTSYPWLLGLFYRCSAREDVWVQFKYERLSEFYFTCGRLRDVSLNCIMSAFKRVAPNIFGPKMRAKSVAYRRYSALNSRPGKDGGVVHSSLANSDSSMVKLGNQGRSNLVPPRPSTSAVSLEPRYAGKDKGSVGSSAVHLSPRLRLQCK